MLDRLPDDYKAQDARTRVATLGQLREAGYTWKEIAEMMGVSESLIIRNWQKGKGRLGRAMTRRGVDVGLLLRDEAACTGTDLPAFVKSPRGVPEDHGQTVNNLRIPEELQNTAALEAYEGYRMCLRCPVRTECVEQISPQEAKFDGVAGGKIWSGGKDVTEEITFRVFVLKHWERNPKGCGPNRGSGCKLCKRRVRFK